VKFSLFFEQQLSDPTRETERQIFHDSLEQAMLADELGYHCVWAVEHHGLFEYSHSSAPEIFLSFVAAKTKRIRIGHGCTLLPFRYNHPIRVAERIATLDILSDGRVNWGTAKSVTRVEREAFEIDATVVHRQWLEALRIIPRMWSEVDFAYEGEFFQIPPIRVIPKPVQVPHPPIFAACSKPEQAVAVGELGIGALNLAIYHDEMLAERVQGYRMAIGRAQAPVGSEVNNHFSCNPASLILKDDRRACRYGLQGARFFLQSMVHYSGKERPIGPTSAMRGMPDEEDIERFRVARNTPGSQLSSLIGDPPCVRETVQRFQKAGVDELILVMQTGTTPHQLVMESIETFAEEVMPHFT
jgi:alkanesulfonate monooxygenase SsuD/methylene tetrahydromethanopterin reductase-like flavin-dependent oxidoreductase (luciferase family)